MKSGVRTCVIARAAVKLSGGERKMLAMGRVLMLDPGVLLDEPTANLAPAVAAELPDELAASPDFTESFLGGGRGTGAPA